MKIVVDTNVLISSTSWAGASNKILQKVENKEIELILSKEIIDEFVKVLGYEEIKQKIKNKNLEMRRSVEKIIVISDLVEPKQKFNIVKEDIDDNKIIDCAVEGNSDYIISQDKHLLKLKEFKQIRIITPEKLLKLMENPLHDLLMDDTDCVTIEEARREAEKKWGK